MDVDALAEQLLDAHVAHVVAELTSEDGASTVAEDVRSVLDALGGATVGDLVDRDAVVATLHGVVADVGPSPAIGALLDTLGPVLHDLPAAEKHRLGELVPRQHVEALVEVAVASEALRDELLRRLSRSPAIANLSLRFVSALVGDAVEQNRKRVERLPGMKTALGVGDFAARQARGLAPKQLEQAIGGAAGKGAHAALERVTRALVDTLDETALRIAALELWDLHAEDTLAGLRAYTTADEVGQLGGIARDVVADAHDSPVVAAVVEAAVDAFLARYGETTVSDLLAEFGSSAERVGEEVARHVPAVVDALARGGHLEPLVRRRLEGFYRSDVLRDLLAAAG